MFETATKCWGWVFPLPCLPLQSKLLGIVVEERRRGFRLFYTVSFGVWFPCSLDNRGNFRSLVLYFTPGEGGGNTHSVVAQNYMRSSINLRIRWFESNQIIESDLYLKLVRHFVYHVDTRIKLLKHALKYHIMSFKGPATLVNLAHKKKKFFKRIF